VRDPKALEFSPNATRWPPRAGGAHCTFLLRRNSRPVFLPNSLIKECEYYKSEVQENQQKLDQMVREGRDPYDIKKFREVLGESEMMVPDSARRMQQAVLDLQSFVRENQDLEGEWQEPARKILLEYAPETNKGVDSCDGPRVVETNVSDLADDEIF
jgi:tubulin-specific chaperone A